MRKEIIKFQFALIILLLLFSSTGITAQTISDHDSLIRIIKTKSFLISNPAPQYIVEIRNDKTISFYNILPENFSEHQSELIENWIIDSTTIFLENSDFIELTKTINGIELENIDKLEEVISESEIEVFISGGGSDNFIIELTNRKVGFSIDPNNENYISNSAKIIRNLIEELETKYKPIR